MTYRVKTVVLSKGKVEFQVRDGEGNLVSTFLTRKDANEYAQFWNTANRIDGYDFDDLGESPDF